MRIKCEATGKSLFETKEEAWLFIFSIKRRVRYKINGRRRKHHMGKPAMKRTYHCPFCGKYHITKWSLEQWMSKQKTREREYHEIRFISFDENILNQFRRLMEQSGS